MKNTRNITLLILLVILVISSCRKKTATEPTEPAQAVTIHFSSPVDGAAFGYGDTIHISAHITGVVDMHGYEWKLVNKADNSVLASGESGEHHSKEYTIDETWVNTLATGAQAELKVTVEATHEDEVEKSVTITLNPLAQGGVVKLAFVNKAGNDDLIYNAQWYMNANNDSFKVSMFRYYITNVRLNSTTGNYTETESYHLLDHAIPSSLNFDLQNVPNGTYTSVTFMIGVDSLRNVSGAQTGALDPVNDMFWSWNTGYIMMKLEGTSPQSTATSNNIKFHVGGFSGANGVLRTVTLNFPQVIEVSNNNKQVNIKSNMLALFASPNIINFAQTSTIHMPGADAKKLADNYANMFSVTSVQ